MKKVLVLCFFDYVIFTILSCLKEADLPALITTEVSNIKTQSAVSGGTVTDDGGAEINISGICWGTANNPTIAHSKTVSRKEGTGSFGCNLFNLIPDTYYHVRAFASNRAGIAYGNEVHFTSLPLVEPEITTTSISDIGYTIARVYGNIESNDETMVEDRGFCVATTQNPTNKDIMIYGKSGVGNYMSWLWGLQPSTIYHVRAFAVTLFGITYGADICFETLYTPTVTTSVIEFTRNSAIVAGNIIWPDDLPGTVSDWGIWFGTEPDPMVKGHFYNRWDPFPHNEVFPVTKDRAFTFPLTNLTPGTTYYVRVFITINEGFPTYAECNQPGNEVSFTTSQ